jgi:hypothetical protein
VLQRSDEESNGVKGTSTEVLPGASLEISEEVKYQQCKESEQERRERTLVSKNGSGFGFG